MARDATPTAAWRIVTGGSLGRRHKEGVLLLFGRCSNSCAVDVVVDVVDVVDFVVVVVDVVQRQRVVVVV